MSRPFLCPLSNIYVFVVTGLGTVAIAGLLNVPWPQP
jgi:hypothetical protein